MVIVSRFWNFINKSEKQAELLLYGNISETTWWGDEVTPKQFLQELNDLGVKDEIVVRINSSGGDVFAAYAIATNLKDNPAKIIGKIDGVAASAATVIASMCDYVMAPGYVAYMIHNPTTIAWGEEKDFVQMAGTLKSIKDGIMNAYVLKTGKSKEELTKMMDETTWLTGKEAVEQGFVDELMFESNTNQGVNNKNMVIINAVEHDFSQFKNVPDNVLQAMGVKPLITVEPKNQQVIPDDINNQSKGGKEMPINNIDDLKKNYPDLVNELIKNTKNEAIQDERNRLKDIDEIADNLDADLVVNAKYGENIMNAQQLAFEAIKNDQSKGKKYLGNVGNDMDESGVEKVTSSAIDNNAKVEKSKQTVNAMVSGANERRK